MEQTSERPVIRRVAKESMNTLQHMGSKVVSDVGMKSLANGVPGKVNVRASEVENTEINITDGINLCEGDDGDATQDPSGSSSSFDDTLSGTDDALALSDDEMNSEFHGSSQPSWAFPGYEEAFRMRKKRLTTHWRNFIRPVMWRCKWAELQMEKFQLQASMYSKILAEYQKGRQSQIENFSTESLCSRSSPFPHQLKRKKIMRRKKRSRVENTTDIASYTQQHSLYAYCENKGDVTDNAHLMNGLANQVNPAVKNISNDVDNNYLLLFGEEETFVEQILAKIDSIQSAVHIMTTRVDKVISENPGKFASLDKLSLLAPCNSAPSTAQDSKTLSDDKDKVIVTSPSMTTQLASELRTEDFDMLITPVTADQSADKPLNTESADQPGVGNKIECAEDEIPLRKRLDPEEPIVYRRGLMPLKKRRMLSEKQPGFGSSILSTKPRGGHTQAQNEKSRVFLASRYTSLCNNQRKRAKRTRARSGRKLLKSLNSACRS